MRPFVVAMLLLAGCTQPAIRIEQAAVAVPSGETAAAYLSIVNESGTDVSLVDVRPGRGRAEIHESYVDGGLMRMRAIPSVPVANGEIVRFEPGGLHIMLFEVAGLAVGDTVELVLRFDDGRELTVTAPVRPVTEIAP